MTIDPGLRSRRVLVAAATLVVGSVLLGFSLAVRPGDSRFYWLSGGVAAVWVVGGLLSGPVPLGAVRLRRDGLRAALTPVVVGLVASGVFVLGALIVREIGPLRDYVDHVLNHARKGSLVAVAAVTVVSGLAEEVFFRGALFSALERRRPVIVSSALYAVATLATGNPMLVFAALVLGLLLAWQRSATGGIASPMLTHVTWSTVLLFALPPLLG